MSSRDFVGPCLFGFRLNGDLFFLDIYSILWFKYNKLRDVCKLATRQKTKTLEQRISTTMMNLLGFPSGLSERAQFSGRIPNCLRELSRV